jgi:CheY-like chemotaxis protein
MGLAVVHGIVKSLKGAITVRSQPGTGSTFSVYLPIVAGEMVRTVREENRPLLGGKERILFVDDEKPIVEMNTMLLERLGYRVTALSSSAAALDLFMRSPDAFDLVITDQIMPDFTGTDLTKKIRSIRKDIPIILITGFSEVIDWERAKKLGINHILMKPIVRRELADAIRNLLDK